MLALGLALPSLQTIIGAVVLILVLGALFTILKPYIDETFKRAAIVICAVALFLWALRLFGVI